MNKWSFNQKFENFLFFSSIPWGHTWERNQEIILRFSQETEKKVVIFPPLGMVSYGFGISLVKKVFNRLFLNHAEMMQNPSPPNAIFLKNFFIPLRGPIFAWINFNLLKLLFKYETPSFVWASYVNETVLYFAKKADFFILDLAERRQKNPHLDQFAKNLEVEAVKIADLVVVDNGATKSDYDKFNEKIVYIPQGFNVEEFTVPEFLREEREFIGYIGNFHHAIDYRYLRNIVESNQNEKFLFVGGVLDNRAYEILQMPNVTHIPPVAKSELIKYMAKMKVGLIPYLVNDHTMGVFPTKMFEYLAAGVPVFSTPLPETTRFEQEGLVYIHREGKVDFKSITLDCEKNRLFLKLHTWDERWKLYVENVAGLL